MTAITRLARPTLRALDAPSRSGFGQSLIRSRVISPHELMLALSLTRRSNVTLYEALIAGHPDKAAEIIAALSASCGATLADPATCTVAEAAVAALGVNLCLRMGACPVYLPDGRRAILVSNPEDGATLGARLGDWTDAVMALAPRADIQTMVATRFRDTLSEQAAARVEPSESCRSWQTGRLRRLAKTAIMILAVTALFFLAPKASLSLLVVWAAITLMVSSALKAMAYGAQISQGVSSPDPVPELADGRLPSVSVLVPLFHEEAIAETLIARLAKLTFPKALLEVVLVLEENDHLTRRALAGVEMPPWMRVIEVPDGKPRTKPRAMNYALDFCRGDIIGVWDAEDAPDPDQISRVVSRFAELPEDVVCLQGILDYYNPRQTWLARCFTIEYAAWFRLMLPGMSRLGLAIPLGGTTLFFRREALETLGGWDAHNVTEDADLGFRLARHGYRAEMVASVTGEEANCHLLPWVKQRSRWLKGYMLTYLVHMRDPALLHRQLGARRFWGFQAHFITALSQILLAPLLWTFWAIPLGLPHPLTGVLPEQMMIALATLFLTAECLTLLVAATAVMPACLRHLLIWVPGMHLYYPIGVLAAYKALAELLVAPFYWDKTTHGHSLNHIQNSQTPLTSERPALRV